MRGIHRSPVNSPHKDQWRGALLFSFICAWINAWVNNGEAGDLRRHLRIYFLKIKTVLGLGFLNQSNVNILRDISKYSIFTSCSGLIAVYSRQCLGWDFSIKAMSIFYVTFPNTLYSRAVRDWLQCIQLFTGRWFTSFLPRSNVNGYGTGFIITIWLSLKHCSVICDWQQAKHV